MKECNHFSCIGPLACVGGKDEKPGVWRWLVCLTCGGFKQWNIEEKPHHYTNLAKADESIPWQYPKRYSK